jgi:hypothetical protein
MIISTASTAAGLIFGFLVATAYGSGFHLFTGGPAPRVILYLIASWMGFALGHFLGDFLGINMLQLGAVHLLAASAGSWLLLVGSWWLVNLEARTPDSEG